MPSTGWTRGSQRGHRSALEDQEGVSTAVRELTSKERELLDWVLPSERQGYRDVLNHLRSGKVIADGRRGEGHLIVAQPGSIPDHESPLPQVLAFGQIEHEDGQSVVTVREPLGDQVDIEITGSLSGAERRRWTLSYWSPGGSCPKCGREIREVDAGTREGHAIAIAICPADKRLWVWDERTGVNHPLPVTLFYSELMKRTQTRDPITALDSSRLFSALSSFSDEDLVGAFVTYNDMRSKVSVDDRIVVPERPKGLLSRFVSIFRRTP